MTYLTEEVIRYQQVIQESNLFYEMDINLVKEKKGYGRTEKNNLERGKWRTMEDKDEMNRILR